MLTAGLNGVVDRLRRGLPADPRADGELVREYAATGSEAAFAELVRRFSPLVWGVCRRAVHDRQLAEDAFQATFLVLVRKAGSVRPNAVGGWLHAVAVHTSTRARAMADRRKARTRPLADHDRAVGVAEPTDADAVRALDDEVSRLPESLRAAVVLCELDGVSRKDAAARLGIAEGTLSSRLASARKRLAAKLRGRGIALAVALALLSRTADAAPMLTSVTSETVSALADGAVRTMFLTKLKLTVVAALAGVTLGTTGVLLVPGRFETGQQPANTGKVIPAETGQQPADADKVLPAQTWAVVPGNPADRYEVFVVAKQYLWKFQHPEGQREIGELHVPIGRPVLLFLISEDVSHSLVVPELNLRVPAESGKYTTAWAYFPKPGRYPIACGQECGPQHQLHTGAVVAVEPTEFKGFLAGMFPSQPVKEGSLAWQGRQLFTKLQCVNCHSGLPDSRGPSLEALFEKTVKLTDGKEVSADEAYFRESILAPEAKVVQGWKPIMPRYKGQVTPEEMTALVSYLRSLKPGETPPRTERQLQGPEPVGQPRLEPLRK